MKTQLSHVQMALANSNDRLAAGAQQEGELTVIGLPRDWCGFGTLIDGFAAKYGLKVNELNPSAGSGCVLETIKRNEPASAPDVIDVGLSFGAAAKREGLLQPYKVTAWDSIPDTVKDPEGFWYGAYRSVLAFEVNVERIKNVPLDWPDLLASEYRNSVALAGNPLVSDQAIRTVYAAGLSAGGGSRDRAAGEGLRFFAELHRRGNLVPRLGDSELLARGVTPILIRWHHLALGDRDRFAGNPKIEVVLPKTGLVGGVYVQAISASAPHPNAAKLWMEYLYSDEAQLAFLSSYSHPIRFDDLVSKGKVPARLLERQPEIRGNQASDAPVFPTVEEQEKAKEIIKNGWDDIIGVEIKCPENVPPARSPTSLNDTLRHSSLAS